MTRLNRILLLLVGVVFLTNSLRSSSNWTEFRGTQHDGCSDATGLPLEWSEQKNIKWKTAIHDRGWSSPVVWRDQIWLTTATADGHQLYAVCVNLQTGKIIHDLLVFENEQPQAINNMNSYATPTPAVEENFVYVHFGTFGTACLDIKTGTKIWERRDLNCNHVQGPASSPIIYQHLLILHLEGDDVQFVTALDKKTGKTVWTVHRPEEHYRDARPLFRKAYITPIIIQVNGQDQLISNGALVCQVLEPLTGKEIWRVVYGYDSTVSMPLFTEGLVLVNTGLDYVDGKQYVRLWAVRPEGHGDVTHSHVVWKMEENVPGLSSPLAHEGLVFMVDDKGTATCLEAKTGYVVWQHKLRGSHLPSPVYAEGRVYYSGQKGKTTVVAASRTFKILAENQLDGEIWASPAIVGRSILLRTDKFLYRIENVTQ